MIEKRPQGSRKGSDRLWETMQLVTIPLSKVKK